MAQRVSADIVAPDVSQPGDRGVQLPLETNDCSRQFGTEGVDRRTEHESKGWIWLTSSYR